MQVIVGGFARVMDELDFEKNSTQCKYFYQDETFVIKDIREVDGITYAQGGKFDHWIPVYKLEPAEKNDNPVPYCRYDLYRVQVGNKRIDLKLMAIYTDLKLHPENTMVAADYILRHQPIDI